MGHRDERSCACDPRPRAASGRTGSRSAGPRVLEGREKLLGPTSNVLRRICLGDVPNGGTLCPTRPALPVRKNLQRAQSHRFALVIAHRSNDGVLGGLRIHVPKGANRGGSHVLIGCANGIQHAEGSLRGAQVSKRFQGDPELAGIGRHFEPLADARSDRIRTRRIPLSHAACDAGPDDARFPPEWAMRIDEAPQDHVHIGVGLGNGGQAAKCLESSRSIRLRGFDHGEDPSLARIRSGRCETGEKPTGLESARVTLENACDHHRNRSRRTAQDCHEMGRGLVKSRWIQVGAPQG